MVKNNFCSCLIRVILRCVEHAYEEHITWVWTEQQRGNRVVVWTGHCHHLQRSFLDRPHSGQTHQSECLFDPPSHQQHYIPVQVCVLYGQKHILHTTVGECERLDRGCQSPQMRHEKKFEGFPRPVYTVLHTDLLHYNEEFVVGHRSLTHADYTAWCPARSFRIVELSTANHSSSKTKKSHPFNIYTNRPYRTFPVQLYDTEMSYDPYEFVYESLRYRCMRP